MTRHGTPSRRGVALVWVLVVLLLAISASAALAAAASSAQAARQMDRSRMGTSDLLHAAEAPILDWLTRRSSAIALPPDAANVGGPEVAVLHDTWTVSGLQYELRITAWDQCGMVPLELIKSGSALRLAAPPLVLEEVDRVELGRSAIPGVPGLDLLSNSFDGAGHRSVYPLPAAHGGPHVFGGGQVESRLPVRDAHVLLAIGAVVATHQQLPSRADRRDRTPDPSASININTAPLELIELALRELGRGGIELIISARAQAKLASIGSAPRQPSRDGDQRIRLVTTSHAWAFRIDARSGQVQQSWWAVYLRSPRGSWECVQRLAITD